MIQRYQQGCIEVVQLDERLTVAEIDDVDTVLTAAIGERLPQVVVDLRRVRLIDSAGLEMLCDAQEKCQSRGGSIRIAAVNVVLRDVLRITELDQAISVHPDVITAAGAFAL